MAQSNREKYERQRAKVQEHAEQGVIDSRDAQAILEWAASFDPKDATTKPERTDTRPENGRRWGNTRKPSTLRRWVIAIDYYAQAANGSILDATADELNQISQDMSDGTLPKVKDSGLSQNTMRTRQNSLRKFLQLVDAEAHPDDITLFDSTSTLVDPADMLTEEEFHAIRQAPDHPRDSALVHMFLYTGQRNAAIRTLRIKDIDIENGRYRLNSDADGLKGADLVGTWNPLLGAQQALRRWLNNHPAPDDREAYVFVSKKNPRGSNPRETISGDTVNRILRNASKKAADEYPAIESKPTHAHAMRHNFVTTAKLEWGFDNDLIKRLIRHEPDSDVMSTTYAHLSDEDYITRAEQQFGMDNGDDEEQARMTPNVCDCGEPLPPDAKACPNCGTLWSGAAKSATVIESDKPDVDDPGIRGAMELVLDEIKDDPELQALIAENLDL